MKFFLTLIFLVLLACWSSVLEAQTVKAMTTTCGGTKPATGLDFTQKSKGTLVEQMQKRLPVPERPLGKDEVFCICGSIDGSVAPKSSICKFTNPSVRDRTCAVELGSKATQIATCGRGGIQKVQVEKK